MFSQDREDNSEFPQDTSKFQKAARPTTAYASNNPLSIGIEYGVASPH